MLALIAAECGGAKLSFFCHRHRPVVVLASCDSRDYVFVMEEDVCGYDAVMVFIRFSVVRDGVAFSVLLPFPSVGPAAFCLFLSSTRSSPSIATMAF